MRFVFIRHAETELNVEGRYQSRLDPPLNAAGAAQARAAASALRPDHWAGVWSSPARRAGATAAELAEVVGTACRELEDLRERDLGELDGMDKRAHQRARPEEARRLERDQSYAPPGGESLADVLARLRRALEFIVVARSRVAEAAESVAVPELVVTHGGVLNALAAHFSGGASRGAGVVGHVRAAGLRLHDLAGDAFSMTGTIHYWDVSPQVCESPWSAENSRGRLQGAVPGARHRKDSDS